MSCIEDLACAGHPDRERHRPRCVSARPEGAGHDDAGHAEETPIRTAASVGA